MKQCQRHALARCFLLLRRHCLGRRRRLPLRLRGLRCAVARHFGAGCRCLLTAQVGWSAGVYFFSPSRWHAREDKSTARWLQYSSQASEVRDVCIYKYIYTSRERCLYTLLFTCGYACARTCVNVATRMHVELRVSIFGFWVLASVVRFTVFGFRRSSVECRVSVFEFRFSGFDIRCSCMLQYLCICEYTSICFPYVPSLSLRCRFVRKWH